MVCELTKVCLKRLEKLQKLNKIEYNNALKHKFISLFKTRCENVKVVVWLSFEIAATIIGSALCELAKWLTSPSLTNPRSLLQRLHQ